MEHPNPEELLYRPNERTAYTGLDEYYRYHDLFDSAQTTPEEVVASLDRFSEILLNFQTLYDRDGGFVTVKHTVRSFMPAALRAIDHDPDQIEALSGFYQTLYNSTPEVNGRQNGYVSVYTTPANKFVAETQEVLGQAADRTYSARTGLSPEDILPAAILADRLTDDGLIKPGFWYQKNVRKASSNPSFPFVENLHRRLMNSTDSSIFGGPNHGPYYLDMYRFINTTLSGMAKNPERHQKNAGIIVDLVSKDISNALPTLSGVVGAANTVGRLINASDGLSQSPSDNELMLRDLDVHDLHSLPAALLRLLYLTRNKTDPELADRQSYEDGVYSEVLSWIVATAANKHEQRYMAVVLKSLGDTRILYPNAPRSQLLDLKSGKTAYTAHTVWRRWQPGYGRLS